MSSGRPRVYNIYAMNLRDGRRDVWSTRAYTAADALVQFDVYRKQPDEFLGLSPRLGEALKIEPQDSAEGMRD